MNQCVYCEDYLNDTLASEQRGVFEAHLEACDACRVQVAKCDKLMAAVDDWSNRHDMEGPTSAEAARLVVALKPRDAVGGVGRRGLYYAVAACVAVALISVFFYRGRRQEIEPVPVARVEPLPIKVLFSKGSELLRYEDVEGEQLSVPGEGQLVIGLGPDRVGLGARTRVEVLRAHALETRLKLREGAVAVAVEPRKDRGVFAIEAGGFVVEVVGTRFRVSNSAADGFQVAVEKGRVRVRGPGQTMHQVRRGQTLGFKGDNGWVVASITADERSGLNGLLNIPSAGVGLTESSPVVDAETLDPAEDTLVAEPAGRPKPSKSLGNRARWRKWILDGRYGEAERALVKHLQTHPRDEASWSLLADCHRKVHKWKAAVKAYKRITALGSGKAANSARFEAAVLLQDKLGNHSAAARLLSAYLETPMLLEADALVRLARAELNQGKTDSAIERLKKVIARYRGTSAAIRARRILDNQVDKR